MTAFAIPPELEKYYDSDSVSCIANLANMTAEEKAKILKESLTEIFQKLVLSNSSMKMTL